MVDLDLCSRDATPVMVDKPIPTIDLESLFGEGGLGASMQEKIQELRWELYYTPKWRKIKRYRLFEKIHKLDEDYALIDHIFNDL